MASLLRWGPSLYLMAHCVSGRSGQELREVAVSLHVQGRRPRHCRPTQRFSALASFDRQRLRCFVQPPCRVVRLSGKLFYRASPWRERRRRFTAHQTPLAMLEPDGILVPDQPVARRALLRLGLLTAAGTLAGCAGTAASVGAADLSADDWPWPEELDAMRAAPGFHDVLLENDHVRMLAARIGPGERTPIHTHRWPSAHHVMSWSDFVRRDGDGTIVLDSRTTPLSASPPEALWGTPLPPHSLENVGTSALYVVSVEVKPAA